MYCPICGSEMASPAPPGSAFPMSLCPTDGVVYDEKRNSWYGMIEPNRVQHCPGCGGQMEGEPKGAPAMHFCFQCGVTYDHQRRTWYGLSFRPEHHG